MDWVGDARSGVLGVDRAELEAAADALIAYYLADRRTDDARLGEVLAVWAEWEDLLERVHELVALRGVLRGGRAARALQGADQAVRERYLAAWRRWLDQQAPIARAGRTLTPDRHRDRVTTRRVDSYL